MSNQCTCMSNLKSWNNIVLQCDLAAATCHASMFLLPLEAFSRFWATLLTRSQATQAHRHLNSLATPWWTLKGTLLLNSAAANSNPGIASKARVYYAKLVELHDNATKRFTSSFYTTATLSILTDQDKLLESPRHGFRHLQCVQSQRLGARVWGLPGHPRFIK